MYAKYLEKLDKFLIKELDKFLIKEWNKDNFNILIKYSNIHTTYLYDFLLQI